MKTTRRSYRPAAYRLECRAQFESPLCGRFEVVMSAGCARFIGRFPLIPELRGGKGVIRYVSMSEVTDPARR